MMQRNPARMTPQSPSPRVPRRQGSWYMLLVGMAFGLGSGILLTIGVITLITANSTTQTPAQVGNSGVSANASLTPAATATATPTPTVAPQPTIAPTPVPTAIPIESSPQIFAPDDPRFYIFVFVIFLFLAGIVLLRKK